MLPFPFIQELAEGRKNLANEQLYFSKDTSVCSCNSSDFCILAQYCGMWIMNPTLKSCFSKKLVDPCQCAGCMKWPVTVSPQNIQASFFLKWDSIHPPCVLPKALAACRFSEKNKQKSSRCV